jgi:hypothetical protein
MHACRFLHVGSFMHACQLPLMRACVRRAYCKKCRVYLALERVGRSNIPVLIPRYTAPAASTTRARVVVHVCTVAAAPARGGPKIGAFERNVWHDLLAHTAWRRVIAYCTAA